MIKKNFLPFLVQVLYLTNACFGRGVNKFPNNRRAALQVRNDADRIAESQASFTRDLYQTIADGSDGNILFSPFSIGVALTMAYLGSEGNTEAEMRSVMSLPEDRNSTIGGFREILRDLKLSNEDYTLKITNRMYLSNVLSILDDYSNTLVQGFGSIPETVDFSQSEAVRQSINEAIENDTNSKIKDLIPPGSLDSLTQLVLTNAVYFNAFWYDQFDPYHTSKSPFWISKDASVDVDMMYRQGNYLTKYDSNLMSTVLKMEYKGGRMSMIVVLPNEESDLAEMEQKLTSNAIRNLDTGLSNQFSNLYFPKFKIEETTQLRNILMNMGINDAFGMNANFEKITTDERLYISNAFHKAFLEVNEKGSEASAATALVITLLNGRSDVPIEIKVDRPFAFFIKDTNTDQILFSGRLVNP